MLDFDTDDETGRQRLSGIPQQMFTTVCRERSFLGLAPLSFTATACASPTDYHVQRRPRPVTTRRSTPEIDKADGAAADGLVGQLATAVTGPPGDAELFVQAQQVLLHGGLS